LGSEAYLLDGMFVKTSGRIFLLMNQNFNDPTNNEGGDYEIINGDNFTT
jgi:hypothetical protein